LTTTPSTLAQLRSSSTTITESERSTIFGNSTSTATAIQVVCLTTATSTINATRTAITYTGVETAFVVKTTVTVTLPVAVTATSRTTISICYAYNESFVATTYASVPLVLYSELQSSALSSTLRQGSTGSPALGSWPKATELLVAILISFSLFAAVLLLLRGEESRQVKRKRDLDGF